MRASYKEQGFNRKAALSPGHPPQSEQLQPWSTLAGYRQLHFLTCEVGWPESLPTTVHTLMAGALGNPPILCSLLCGFSLVASPFSLEQMFQFRGDVAN